MALIDNQVAYYKLDVNGTVADATGTQSNARVDGATYTATGKINGGYSFDGTNDAIDLNFTASTYINSSADWSISCWCYATALSINRGVWGSLDSSNYGITLMHKSATGKFHIWSDGWHDTNINFVINTWYHCVVTYKASTNTISVYINNGTPYTYVDTWTDSSEELWLGQMYPTFSNLETFSGTVDEVGVWNKTLSSAEVTELYNSGDGFQYPYRIESPFKYQHGGTTNAFAADTSISSGEGLCYQHSGSTYYFSLVDTGDANASPYRIKVSSGTKAIEKYV